MLNRFKTRFTPKFNTRCKTSKVLEISLNGEGWKNAEEAMERRVKGAQFNSVQFSSVAQSCLTLCDPMDCSTPGLPVHHQLQEITQTHVHWVGDAIQPSHPLLSPSSPAFNLSQHQGLFQCVSSLHQVAKVLEVQLQHPVLPMNIQDLFPLGWAGWIFLQSKGRSRVFSNTTIQKHQFFGPQLSFATRMEDWTSLGQQKRHPEFPVVTRESRRNSRKTTWFPRHCEG